MYISQHKFLKFKIFSWICSIDIFNKNMDFRSEHDFHIYITSLSLCLLIYAFCILHSWKLSSILSGTRLCVNKIDKDRNAWFIFAFPKCLDPEVSTGTFAIYFYQQEWNGECGLTAQPQGSQITSPLCWVLGKCP